MASKGRDREGIGSSAAAGPPTPDAGPPPLAPMGAVLGVEEIERASRFYQALGFQQQFALPRADGQLTLAVLSYGSSTLLLGRLDELHDEHEARAKSADCRESPTWTRRGHARTIEILFILRRAVECQLGKLRVHENRRS